MAGMISSLRGRGGGNSVIRPIRECAAGQGMVFYLSDLNRLYILLRKSVQNRVCNVVRVCLNYKQDIASTITSSIRVYSTYKGQRASNLDFRKWGLWRENQPSG